MCVDEVWDDEYVFCVDFVCVFGWVMGVVDGEFWVVDGDDFFDVVVDDDDVDWIDGWSVGVVNQCCIVNYQMFIGIFVVGVWWSFLGNGVVEEDSYFVVWSWFF